MTEHLEDLFILAWNK